MKRQFIAVIKCPKSDCNHEFTEFDHEHGHSCCPKCLSDFSNYRSELTWDDEIGKYIIGYKIMDSEWQ
jgi:hypothetical protein